MDFMKVFDQTVREIKREVNLKVLKVPEIEQKVLDATDDEPWGPHGTVLAEIAQATKNFTVCQMVMNVLWTRLGETGKDWRLVYKALAVIEYLVAHGSERAVDDIIEHTFQISSLSTFEFVEPSGKDVGLNVRKKAETIVALLNDKDKIQEVRNKAAANRDKYFGLSSTGITYKSGVPSFSCGSFRSIDQYGGMSGTREDDGFRDTNKGRGHYGEGKIEKDTYGKSCQGVASDDTGNTWKKGSARFSSKDQSNTSSCASSKISVKFNDKNNTVPSQCINTPPSNVEDDFDDDFNPRGTSSAKPSAQSSNQVNLFGENLIVDLMDASPSVPTETSTMNGNSSEVDLFADATFVSAPTQVEKGTSSQSKTQVDLFASQPAIPSTNPSAVDFFSTADLVVEPETKALNSSPMDANIIDPFAAVPLNNFDGSDIFGAFSSSSNSEPVNSTQSAVNDGSLDNLDGRSFADSKSLPKKETFKLKSGIWADSLSRGLINLNLSASKKVSLADVGIVGDLSARQDEREKAPAASFYTGRATDTSSGGARSGFVPTPLHRMSDDLFSNHGDQHY